MIEVGMKHEENRMQTLVLSDQTAAISLGGLIEKSAGEGLEVRDQNGKVVAYLLSPDNRGAWLYAQARLDFEEHRQEIELALTRKGGISTAELLAKAVALGESATRP
ncbi:MAG: hypothetical protein SFU86_24555 [Pirellulaceae bacterium]|nr:hypothetical protein [Pirellulaceae bacterium]